MNFKDEYKKAFVDISAGDDFKKQLEKELSSAASPRRRYTPYVGMLATAAALAIMVGAAQYTGVFRDAGDSHSVEESLVAQESSGKEDNKDIYIRPNLGADRGNSDMQGQSFKPQASWCAGIESDTEKYELFVNLLGGEEVKAVYASREQGFTEDDVMSPEEIAKLAQSLEGAAPVENVTESNVVYYKAVLEDGRTIVFQIWDGEMVRVAGVETIYQISK